MGCFVIAKEAGEFLMSMITPLGGWDESKQIPVFCGNCGKEVPNDKRFCTGCGSPAQGASLAQAVTVDAHAFISPPPYRTERYERLPKSHGVRNFLFFCLAFFFVVFVIARETKRSSKGASSNRDLSSAPAATSQPEKLTWMDTPELLAFYHRNEVAADAALKGRRIGVTATVESINKDFLDQPYLVLEGSDNMFDHVQAGFSNDHLSELMDVQKGQAIRISCKVRGEMVDSVMLGNCQFVSAPEPARVAPATEPAAAVTDPTPTATTTESASEPIPKEINMTISPNNPYRLEGNYSGWQPKDAQDAHQKFLNDQLQWELDHVH